MANQPNILFIMSDQHTPSVAGCYGNRQVHTPNLDRLAADGVVFDNAYCNNPVCVPSRMSMLTGLHSHNCDVWTNCHPLPPHLATWPLLLRLCGYETVISGRNHLIWGDRLAGFSRRLCGDQGHTVPYIGPDATSQGSRGPQAIETHVGPNNQAGHAHLDMEANREAIRYLRSVDGRQPFVLFVGYYQPHAPFQAIEECYDLYRTLDVETGDYETLHDLYVPYFERLKLGRGLDPEALKNARRAYYAMVTHIDRLIGEVMETLSATGLLDNTIVIYASDHGEMLGRHRLWHKMNFYEDSVRVPLIVSCPSRFTPGRRVDRNVSLLDLFPTFLDFAGSTHKPRMEGRSLTGLLAGDADGWDNRVIAESIGVVRGEPGRMLKRDHLKLLVYHNRPPVLFDLKRDPRENTDFAGDSAYRGILDSMLTEIAEGWNVAEINRSIDTTLEHVYFHHLAGTSVSRSAPMPFAQRLETVRVDMPAAASPTLRAIAAVCARQIEHRCGAHAARDNRRLPVVELAVAPGVGAEGFTITDGVAGAIRIVGHDERGVLYGVGKLLRTARYAPGRFMPGAWRGASRPAKRVRGIYFATHFYNYYQTAPIEQIERYVEELALWGMNTLAVWYDMHHFNGFDDPEAAAFRERLRRILQAARRLGLDVQLMVIGNEAYADSPARLRAAPGGGRGGYYDVAICPAKPGGLDYILEILGRYFDWARDLTPATVCIWPYDQGGCGCPECQPWGSQGFVRCAAAIGTLARQKLPGVKVMLSTWYFDAAEWQQLARTLADRPGLADAVLMEQFRPPHPPTLVAEGAALGVPVVGFPEISMQGMFPWGGFGANPQPGRFHAEWQRNRTSLAGGFPYSEGLFEDINKVLWQQLYWDPDASAESILDEYTAHEFGLADAAPVRDALATLERNHHLRWWPGELEGAKLAANWFPSKGVAPRADPGAEDAYAAMQRADATLPAWARQAWRWRILFLRALLDSELKCNGGKPTAACLDAFQELNRIYCVTHRTDAVVRAPLSMRDGVGAPGDGRHVRNSVPDTD